MAWRGISPPLLGRYQPEKAANADPVAEASQVLVGKAAVAVRPNPVAFMRMTTAPDPFEQMAVRARVVDGPLKG